MNVLRFIYPLLRAATLKKTVESYFVLSHSTFKIYLFIHLFIYGRLDHDQQHCYHHAPTVKPEAATAVVELLMIGVRTPDTC